MILLLVVFLGSVGVIGAVMYQYRQIDKLYDAAVQTYTQENLEVAESPQEPEASAADAYTPETEAKPEAGRVIAPITVDFAGLQAVNPEVVGWLYCEGTNINYPVMQGSDDDYYLTHSYDRAYNISGSIFVEAGNSPGFTDLNTIIYGHNMKNEAMFAHLDNWAEQSYYDAHPVMWLLTPERDYRIELFSGYTTSAYSDTYLLFPEPGDAFDAYLQRAAALSDFRSEVTLDKDGRYVLLSTCAYVFDNARFVLHGKLSPVDSAGGVPVEVQEGG